MPQISTRQLQLPRNRAAPATQSVPQPAEAEPSLPDASNSMPTEQLDARNAEGGPSRESYAFFHLICAQDCLSTSARNKFLLNFLCRYRGLSHRLRIWQTRAWRSSPQVSSQRSQEASVRMSEVESLKMRLVLILKTNRTQRLICTLKSHVLFFHPHDFYMYTPRFEPGNCGLDGWHGGPETR